MPLYAFFIADWYKYMPYCSERLYTAILKQNFNFDNKKRRADYIADILPIICKVFFSSLRIKHDNFTLQCNRQSCNRYSVPHNCLSVFLAAFNLLDQPYERKTINLYRIISILYYVHPCVY